MDQTIDRKDCLTLIRITVLFLELKELNSTLFQNVNNNRDFYSNKTYKKYKFLSNPGTCSSLTKNSTHRIQSPQEESLHLAIKGKIVNCLMR